MADHNIVFANLFDCPLCDPDKHESVLRFCMRRRNILFSREEV